MTVMEHLKAAGFDIENAKHIYGDGHAECDRIEIRTSRGSDGYDPLIIVEARAIVKWSDGGERPYPEFGWDGQKLGYNVTAYLVGEVA